MSDEESRKAFMEWFNAQESSLIPFYDCWQAGRAYERERTKGLWALAKYGYKCFRGEESESDLSELGLMTFDKHAGIWIETDLAKLPGES